MLWFSADLGLAAIDWCVNPIAVTFGFVQVRYYGICFLAAILTAIKLLEPRFKALGRDTEEPTELVIYVVLGLLIGSRLVHCLFYDPIQYLSRPWTILYIWEGGLASHGAGIGAIAGTYVWANGNFYRFSLWLGKVLPKPLPEIGVALFGKPQYTPGFNLRKLADLVIPAMTVSVIYIRLGNLFNHEIIGRPTTLPWGFNFWGQSAINYAPSITGASLPINLKGGVDVSQVGEAIIVRSYLPAPMNLWALLALIALGAGLAILFQRWRKEEVIGFPWHHFFWIACILRVAWEFTFAGHPSLPEGMNYSATYALADYAAANLKAPAPGLRILSRHPSQVYEILMGFFLFPFFVWLAWRPNRPKRGDGFYLFSFLALYFAMRFGVEYFKDFQSDYAKLHFDKFGVEAPFTMGQYLSLPFVLIGLGGMAYTWKPPADAPLESSTAPTEPANDAKPKS